MSEMLTVIVELPARDPVLADFLEASGQLPAAMAVRGAAPVVYLWLLSQTEAPGWDTYDSCVVAAFDEESAKRVHPTTYGRTYSDEHGAWLDRHGDRDDCSSWATTADNVTAERVGVAHGQQSGTVVCASFNAG
jgi:hypothetical protein